MSNEEKTVWLETFWERLNDRCTELNNDKYQASDMVDFLEGHYNFSIEDLIVTVQYEDTVSSPPPLGAFISFAKDKRINTSSLLGYYASVKFVNDSTDKIELFSIGSNISESSK